SGAYATVNGISISNAFVLGPPAGSTALPAGSSASFFVGLYNGGASDDTLLSVAAPGAATSATIDGGPVSLPANASANPTGPDARVVLPGLTKPVGGGQAIAVTLDFEHAGLVTLDVPVEPQSFYYSTYSPPASVTPTATPSP